MNEKKIAYIKHKQVNLTSVPSNLPVVLRIWGPSWFRNKGIRLDEYQLREMSSTDHELVTDHVGKELVEEIASGNSVELRMAYFYNRRVPIKTSEGTI